MKLLAATDGAGKRAYVDSDFDWQGTFRRPVIRTADAVLTGYADVSSARNWALYHGVAGISPVQTRNELIALSGGWAGMSADERKALIEWFAFPASATAGELNALYSQSIRDAFRDSILALCDTRRTAKLILATDGWWLLKIAVGGILDTGTQPIGSATVL